MKFFFCCVWSFVAAHRLARFGEGAASAVAGAGFSSQWLLLWSMGLGAQASVRAAHGTSLLHGMWDLPRPDRTCVTCVSRQMLNHWTIGSPCFYLLAAAKDMLWTLGPDVSFKWLLSVIFALNPGGNFWVLKPRSGIGGLPWWLRG